MIAGLKPYPAMKDSGVPWLGEVPEHWAVARLKGHLRRNDSGVWSEDAASDGTIVLRSTEQTVDGGWRIDHPARIHLTTTQREAATLATGDLVVTKSSGSASHIGKTSLVTAEIAALGCCFSNFMQRLRPARSVDSRFLWQLLNCPAGREQLVFHSTSTTGLGNLNGTILGECRLGVPPLPEQAAIVRFLGHADRRIRRYIRSRQKLIKLLEEQKQAIIHRAVTRGLDPDVRLKPSGVEWLGDVPEHWEVMLVKQVAQVLRGKFTHRPRNDPSLYDGQYPFIQTGEVARAGKSITSFRQTLNERGLAVSKLFPAGTLVMTIAANIGDVAILDFEACFPDSMVGFVPRAQVERDFLYYLFVAMKPELLREAPINTQGNLNVDRIGARAIVLPPDVEQQTIVRSIEANCASLTGAIDKARQEVTLFHEYRTRLIADVVTGKLDVREAAARLPEEIDDGDELEGIESAAGGEEAAGDDFEDALEDSEA